MIAMEINDLFARARDYTHEDVGWSPVQSSGGMRMSHLSTPQGVSLLRAQYQFPVSFQEAMVIARPEVFTHPRRCEFDTMLEQCGIVQVFAPGDAVVWFRPRLSPMMRRLASLTGAMRGLACRADGDEQNPIFAKTRLRMVMRRDFPHPGKFTVIAAPLDPDTGELLEEWGLMLATVAVVEPDCDASQVVITQVQLRTWKATHMMPLAIGRHHGVFEVFVCHGQSQEFREAIYRPGSYVVVGIRRFHKGAPLLPKQGLGTDVTTAPTDWDQSEGKNFALPKYLCEFGSRLGLELEAWSCLDGRQLVSYQAAVRTDAWEHAWAALESIFRSQRVAYRRLFGGSDAPGLLLQAPRFHVITGPEATWEVPTKRALGVPEHKTFVHFQDQANPSLRRSGSEPSFDWLNC